MNPQPIYLELDQKREIAYTVGSALVLRANGDDVRMPIESAPVESGPGKWMIRPGVVVSWLTACLQREQRRTGDVLDEEWVKDQLDTDEKLWAAGKAVVEAFVAYMGKEVTSGEANRPAKARRRTAKDSR